MNSAREKSIHEVFRTSRFYFGQTKHDTENWTKVAPYSGLNISNDVSMSIRRSTVLEIIATQNMDVGCVRDGLHKCSCFAGH